MRSFILYSGIFKQVKISKIYDYVSVSKMKWAPFVKQIMLQTFTSSTVAHKVQFEILLQMSQTIESVGVNWTSVVWVRYNKLGQ